MSHTPLTFIDSPPWLRPWQTSITMVHVCVMLIEQQNITALNFIFINPTPPQSYLGHPSPHPGHLPGPWCGSPVSPAPGGRGVSPSRWCHPPPSPWQPWPHPWIWWEPLPQATGENWKTIYRNMVCTCMRMTTWVGIWTDYGHLCHSIPLLTHQGATYKPALHKCLQKLVNSENINFSHGFCLFWVYES